jgi:hypothetical protein
MASLSKQEQNKQVVHQLFELLGRHDTERMEQLLVSSTIIDRRITEGWITSDTMSFMQQIGAISTASHAIDTKSITRS